MSELGPATDIVATVVQGADENVWIVETTNDAVINIEYDADNDLLVLSSELGQPADADRAAAYELCLIYNSLSRQTGVRIELIDRNEPLELLGEFGAEAINLQGLQTLVENFSAKVAHWKENLSSVNAGESAVLEAAPLDGMRV